MAPLIDMGGSLHWSSWMDEHLPNILWACICAGCLERDRYLDIFREIAALAKPKFEKLNYATLCHNFLATLDQENFNDIFSPIAKDAKAREACSVLARLDSLPDHQMWGTMLNVECEEIKDAHLAKGIVSTLDHQSQEATDVRWAKVHLAILSQKMMVPPDFAEEVHEYPTKGDMRSVRPKIRAFEMAVRSMEVGSEKPDFVPDSEPSSFWAELLDKTPCAFRERDELKFAPRPSVQKELDDALNALFNHFMENIKTTTVDARLDGAFGIVFYMLCLTIEMAHSPSSNYASGRIVLRTVVENLITLRYLGKKDDPAIWSQYRNYGSGQTALAFLKNSFSNDPAASIDLDRLEILANEDAWMESKDIEIGAWAKLNLRKMAELSDTKDLYDSHYDWTSGFVHGHWGAVRDATFTTCMNPLHRLHRVPMPLASMPSVVEDCCKLCNRALDEINHLYPSFKTRIAWKVD